MIYEIQFKYKDFNYCRTAKSFDVVLGAVDRLIKKYPLGLVSLRVGDEMAVMDLATGPWDIEAQLAKIERRAVRKRQSAAAYLTRSKMQSGFYQGAYKKALTRRWNKQY